MKRLPVVAVLVALSVILFSFAKPPVSPISKSLIFPVAGKKSIIGSFWGAARDGGKRKHEGIDIFARKGTAVVAVSDGIIVSRGTTPRGGKILWLQSTSHPISAYYAHLDQHKVKTGEFVRKGQVIGTVGNTGNAKYTPAHLHFGIYKYTGAVNPLPYVKNSKKITVPSASRKLQPLAVKNNNKLHPIKKTPTNGTKLQASSIVRRIKIAADPLAQYLMTTQSHVIRVYEGRRETIGKWRKSPSIEYPYTITLADKKQVYINRSGQILTADGKQVGSVG